MNINVSAWSIRTPVPSVLLFIMLTIVGVMGFRAMKIQQFPDIDLPTVTVTATAIVEPTFAAIILVSVVALLLNASLTVERDRPASHAKLGWQALTDAIVARVAAAPQRPESSRPRTAPGRARPR